MGQDIRRRTDLAHEVLLVGIRIGRNVGYDFEGLPEKAMDKIVVRLVGILARPKHGFYTLRQPVPVAGIYYAIGIEAGGVGAFQPVIGKVNKTIPFKMRLPAMLPGELLHDPVDGPVQLVGHVLIVISI